MAVVYPGYRSTPTTSNITIGGGGAGSTLTIATGTGGWPRGEEHGIWASTGKTTVGGKLQLNGPDADLVINGVKLSDTLNSITERLAILQPKPELLEKYDNLKQAYDHYKTLEALLHQTDDDAK